MKIVYLLILCFCCLFCFSKTAIVEIKFDPDNMQTSELGLSDFIESIEYIPLETKNECLIGDGMTFDFDETHIIVKFNGAESVLLFDRKGHFLNSVGRRGGGPEEYQSINNVFLDSWNNSIIVESVGKALYYNKNGEYLRSTSLPIDDRIAVSYFQEQFLRMADSYVFRDSIYYVYTIYNQNGIKVKEEIPSVSIPLRKNSNTRISYKCKEIVSTYIYQNEIHVREYLNDTIYVINKLNHFMPKYIFKLGKYKMTSEIQADLDHFEDRIFNKVFIQDVIEMSEKLLIQYFYKGSIHSCYYDKQKCKLYKFDTSGYPNDYDGGIDFIVGGTLMGQKNQYVRTFFNASDFVLSWKQNRNRDRKIRGPKSAIQTFNKLANKVTPEDNPIIMIMKLKQ